MRDFISECLSKNNDSILFDRENKITYAELLHKAEKNGEILKKLLPPKSKCAILCDRGLHAATAILACWYADLAAVPMSKHYGEKYCKNIIDLTKPDVVICDTDISFEGIRFDLAANEITNGKTVSKTEGILYDVAAIMCTSGTTGTPKGAMITEHGLIKNVENIAAYFGVKKDDTIMIARPLYHCAALTGEFLVSLYKGLNIGFFDESYDPISAVNFINENEITVFCGTPT
ncbi:MAG: acyl--CoA ligase, partial [Oscillospiraceae bacterium]|nr:acyl--CoA ligase [Oscillospiraceae bacterium]